MSDLAKGLFILFTEARPRRLFFEDIGVKSPTWFGRKPDSVWHIWANLFRLLFAFGMPPLFLFIPRSQSIKSLLRQLLWATEWYQVPDAVLLEAPGALQRGEKDLTGKYAVTGNKPGWLLEVHFRNGEVASQRQVRYNFKPPTPGSKVSPSSALQKSIQQSGYTAISYYMESAKELFDEAGRELDPQPGIEPGGQRKYSLPNRKKISQMALEEYAKARMTIPGKGDGYEFIWLDEFCLSDDAVTDEKEMHRQRSLELGQLADIFRNARRVAVFCHVIDCDHTETQCPWGQRLFTIGEIMHTPEVLQMTRTEGPKGHRQSSITIVPGPEFRADMQARAAEAKMWHLYNIMQHATSSGAVPWQSAIHSLVVEAIRRDEAGKFDTHHLLGKALNGLLPRKSQLGDLQGENGWADLAWLLELNQGYYNVALLAAVCKLADPWVKEYRWWGKPIMPKEGCERLEPLATAIPVKVKTKLGVIEPVLSIIGPKTVKLTNMLRRDGGALYHEPDMRSLQKWAAFSLFILVLAGFINLLFARGSLGLALIMIGFESYVLVELLVGTIYVRKDSWVALEDHLLPGRDPRAHLQSQDPTFTNAPEWGPRQLLPEWDHPHPGGPSPPWEAPRPYSITLMDLRTGVTTKVAVTSRPNDMVALAVHGGGITCMLLDRDEKALAATISKKVGMVNLPPFVLSEAVTSGTVYIGGGPLAAGEEIRRPPPITTTFPAPPNRNLHPGFAYPTTPLSAASPYTDLSPITSTTPIPTTSGSPTAALLPSPRPGRVMQSLSISSLNSNATSSGLSRPSSSGKDPENPSEPASHRVRPYMVQAASSRTYSGSTSTLTTAGGVPAVPAWESPSVRRKVSANDINAYQESSQNGDPFVGGPNGNVQNTSSHNWNHSRPTGRF